MKTKKTFQKRLLASVFGAVALAGVVGAVAASCTDTKPGQVNLQQTQAIASTESNSQQAAVKEDYQLVQTDANSFFRTAMTDPYKTFEMLAENLDKVGYKIEDHAPLKDKGYKTFKEYAQAVNTKIKHYVKAVANLPRIQELRNKNTTVLYAETTQGLNASDASKLDLYYYQQPTLFPILYANPDSPTPGFGLHFPKPNSHNADKWFDSWYGIGAAQNNSATDNTWRTGLYEGFSGRADYVFYNYNSNNLLGDTTKEAFEKFFKESIKNDKVIPVDFQFDYASIWGPVGTLYFVDAYAKRLGVTQADLDTIKDKKPEIPQTQEYLRIKGSDKKLAVHFYNLWDHMVMLGIQPDYSNKNSKKGRYQKVAGVFEGYIKDLSKTDFETLDSPDQAKITSANLYAYATNESHWNRTIKPLVKVDGDAASASKPDVKGVFTQRGDNDLTTSPFTQYFYDRKTNTLHKVVGKPSETGKGKGKKFVNWGDQPAS